MAVADSPVALDIFGVGVRLASPLVIANANFVLVLLCKFRALSFLLMLGAQLCLAVSIASWSSEWIIMTSLGFNII